MKKFWDSSTEEQQSTLAASVGSTPSYLRLAFNGYRKVDFNLAKKLGSITSGQITKYDPRPDIYSRQ